MKKFTAALVFFLSVFLVPVTGVSAAVTTAKAGAIKVTVLSTMLADLVGIGEWGFAALIEVDGYKVLFDTGARPETVLRNAEELGIDLSQVTDVILSHNHDDHIGGLLKLRQTLQAKNPAALSHAHAATGIYAPRRYDNYPNDFNSMPMVAEKYLATGAKIILHEKPAMIAPGVWVTGPVTRRFPEKNYEKASWIVTPNGEIADTVPEDMSLVVDGQDGLVVVTGCGHAGIGNIMAQSRELVPGPQPSIKAVIGGLHLLDANEDTLAWTADQMRKSGVAYLLAGHCSGLEALYRMRALLRLERKAAVVAAVGSSYSSSTGINPLWLAH